MGWVFGFMVVCLDFVLCIYFGVCLLGIHLWTSLNAVGLLYFVIGFVICFMWVVFECDVWLLVTSLAVVDLLILLGCLVLYLFIILRLRFMVCLTCYFDFIFMFNSIVNYQR